MFHACALTRQSHTPIRRHLAYAKFLLRYISGSKTFGLRYLRSQELAIRSIRANVDADWGGCKYTRKSTTGYVIDIKGTPDEWGSKKQKVPALSSAESEYVALFECAKQFIWMRKLFWEFVHKQPWWEEKHFEASKIHIDSTFAISLATNEQNYAKNKHVDMKLHHVKELLRLGVVRLSYV